MRIPEQLRGWRLVKLRHHDKVPVEPDWPNRTYAWDDPELLKWIEQSGNYGVVGNKGHVIVDADALEVQEAVERYLPETFTVQTPGHLGRHYYFVASIEGPIRLRDRSGRNVGDVQGWGKQVVGPSCIHPNGGIYEIVKNVPCAEITKEQLREALAEFLAPDIGAATWEAQERESEISILSVHPLNGMRAQGNEFYGPHPIHGSETGRNFWINPLLNVWHCFRHETGGGPLSLLAIKEKIIRCEEAKPGALRGVVFKRVLEKAREKGLIKRALETAKNREFVPAEIAGMVQAKFRFATHKQSHEIWVYKNGVYYPDGEEIIRTEVRELLGDDATDHRVNEVVSHIRDTTFTDPEKFSPRLELINLENGVLNLKTGELEEHTPEIIFTNKLPVRYDSSAKCPKILKFLSEVLHPDDIPVVQEFVGYCLYRKYCFARALMLLGGGSNGKSTLLELITALLGRDNVANPSLQDLIYNRFTKADLFGKLANIHADIPSTKLARTGTFKMLTGGDTLYAEKKHKDPFNFINYAKLIYSANELPQTEDLTEAFWRRWIVVEFPNTFPEGDPRTDPHLLRKITMSEELSGFLNWALEGLKRLLENGRFSASRTIKEVEKRWTLQTDSLRAFVIEYVGRDPSCYVTKEDFYAAYQDFCSEHEAEAVSKNMVGMRLPTLAIGVKSQVRKIEDKAVKVWQGIRLIGGYGDKINQVTKLPSLDLSTFSGKRECGVLNKVKTLESGNSVTDTPLPLGAAPSPQARAKHDLKHRIKAALRRGPMGIKELAEALGVKEGEEKAFNDALSDLYESEAVILTPLEYGKMGWALNPAKND